MNTLEEHLKFCNFDKYFKKLVKKLKGKTIIVYGTGSLFQLIQEKYDLSQLNIIGVCDNKYVLNEEGRIDLGYKVIPLVKLEDYQCDVVLLGLLNYTGVLYDFVDRIYKNSKTEVLPLVRKPLLKALKDIWF